MNIFKILKKRQIIIIVITLMLITAGYFKYKETNSNIFNQILESAKLIDTEKYAGLGDAVLVSGEVEEEKENTSEANQNKDENQNEENIEVINQEFEEKNNQKEQKKIEENYYDKSRLEREKMYSQMLETYQEILEKQTISSEQKAIAQNEIIKINKERNVIMITENLILAKGFKDVIVFINENKANVIIKSEELKQEEISQIQNIITRELNLEMSNVNISTK